MIDVSEERREARHGWWSRRVPASTVELGGVDRLVVRRPWDQEVDFINDPASS
jgi:hypothetical protein